jgi:class 3 adenylate cyclase/predicted ATPase
VAKEKVGDLADGISYPSGEIGPMNCSRCGHDNEAGAKFCEECAAPLTRACASCGRPLSATAKFCPECAHPTGLAGAPTPTTSRFGSPEAYTPKHLAERILTSKAALEGERKQVTVLFADLKGSMELLADRDPEEARKILDPVLERLMEAVHRYEGTVNQVMGDGIMALFGAPLAHEDHAVRACYAALRMQASVQALETQLLSAQGVSMQIRVGVNSGEVVVRSIGNDLHMDYTAVGQTTHLAARMEQIARPGAILITAETLKLAEGYVDVKPLGLVPVKGVSEPVEVFEVTGAGPIHRRLQAMATRTLSRFVGRDSEMEHLRRAVQQAGEGRGQLVAVVGEPGVGKSRLFFEFTRSHHARGWLALECGSVSYGKATPYLPIVDLLKGYFKIDDRDDQRQVREKITGKLLTLDRALETCVPPFLTLFDVAFEDPEWHASDPRHRRQRTLDAVKRLLVAEGRVQPLLLVFEDLHWIDSETEAFLDALFESLPTARILVLANYRPEYQHGWGQKTYYTQLRIDPLPSASAEELLHALLGPDPALDPLRRLLIERTEGNPFFLEESVRSLVETRALVGERGAYRLARAVQTLQIPATAQAILAARIDRLSPEHKRVLQAASVIGKDVPYSLLRAVAEQSDEALRGAVVDLQATEFLYETRLFPDVEYTFKHALTHEVTYGTLLHDRRRALHTRIVAAIEQLYGDRLGEQIELLAHHAVKGEAWDKAVVYLRDAGIKAFVRSANADAVSYLTRGLEIVETLPPGVDRERHELALLLALGPAIQAMTGLGAPEAERVFSRARELSERLGEAGLAFQALWGQWMVSAGLGRITSARRIGGELFTLAQRTNDRALLLEGHHAMWATSFWIGELSAAEQHIERGISLYDREQHRSLAFLYGGHDAGACCRYFSMLTQWLLGRPIRAGAARDAAITLAEEIAHPTSLAQALTWACALLYFERDAPATGHLARRLIDLATERELPPWLVAGMIFDGWSRAETGDGAAGIARIREGLSAAKTTGTLMPLGPLYTMIFADACLKLGQADDGLRATDDALAMMRTTGVRVWESELHRLKGELLLVRAPADAGAAEACFREALAIARQQGAQGWELRAAMSLGRLLRRHGRRDEARQALTAVYERFTEGLESANLLEARALLAELS